MASTPPQTEKPFHYTYLKEFRVNQCPLFLQHKCTQHRPFTCFHWHFSNQRRRRPVRKRDGTFNYSADVYCSKYDETTGVCPDGDECQYIHRNTGDTERRYHLRYYKTGTCIHETDSRGNCVKNGPHCAFAHGANDLRPPVYDIREQQTNEQAQQDQASISLDSVPQENINLFEKIVNEDPKWQDANYVLANYKTEVCKRPPRLCRQGYACPQYHNAKDRRRNPKKYKYRSSPCPNVKQGDDWKDPSACEKGDSCQFCHTRTEQQFHPEIYKSTKCHDMTQTGYCPRGPFCAFAHVEQEIRIVEDGPLADGNFEQPSEGPGNYSWSEFARNFNLDPADYSRSMPSQSLLNEYNLSRSFPTCPSPISKPRTTSLSNGKGLGGVGDNYSKAPGSERNLSESGGLYNNNSSSGSIPWALQTRRNKRNSLNSDAVPFYPPDETVDSVVGNALDDLDLDEGGGGGGSGDKADVRSVTQQGNFWQRDATLYQMSAPVNIPGNVMELSRNPMLSISPTTLSNAFGGGGDIPGINAAQSGAFQRHHNQGGHFQQSMPTVGSLGTPGSLPGSIMSASLGSGVAISLDLERMQQKCKQWEESWNQAKIACDAWKREATEANERARVSEERCGMAIERCRLMESQLQSALDREGMQDPVSSSSSPCSQLHQAVTRDALGEMALPALKDLATRYKEDLAHVEKLVWEFVWPGKQQ